MLGEIHITDTSTFLLDLQLRLACSEYCYIADAVNRIPQTSVASSTCSLGCRLVDQSVRKGWKNRIHVPYLQQACIRRCTQVPIFLLGPCLLWIFSELLQADSLRTYCSINIGFQSLGLQGWHRQKEVTDAQVTEEVPLVKRH